MKAVAAFEDVDDIKLSITVTMTLREWSYIKRDLSRSSTPSDFLLDVISDGALTARSRIGMHTEKEKD